MGFFKKVLGGIGDVAKGAWSVLDPLTPDEYIGAAGSALKGDWGKAWSQTKTGLKDAVRGAAVGLGGAGLAGVGPLAALGGTGSAVAGGAAKVASGLGGGAMKVGSALLPGAGMSSYDKWALGLGLAGTAAGVYGDYQAGQGADEDRALAARQWEQEFGRQTGLDTEDTRRWDLGFGEDTRQFDTTFGEGQRQYDTTFGEGVRQFDLTRGDTRSDVEYERDLMNRKGKAVSPFVGRLLKLGAA